MDQKCFKLALLVTYIMCLGAWKIFNEVGAYLRRRGRMQTMRGEPVPSRGFDRSVEVVEDEVVNVETDRGRS